MERGDLANPEEVEEAHEDDFRCWFAGSLEAKQDRFAASNCCDSVDHWVSGQPEEVPDWNFSYVVISRGDPMCR